MHDTGTFHRDRFHLVQRASVVVAKWATLPIVCVLVSGWHVLKSVDEVAHYSEFNLDDPNADCRSDCAPEPYFGFGRYWRVRNSMDIRHIAGNCFDDAWDRYEAQCHRCPSKHFKNGFRDAFYEIADGGDGKVPPIPPKKYWNAYYRSPEGKVYAQQWFNGFRVGAATAIRRGLDRMNEIATSTEACGCGGTGCASCSTGSFPQMGEPLHTNDGFWSSDGRTAAPPIGEIHSSPNGSMAIPDPGTPNALQPHPDPQMSPVPLIQPTPGSSQTPTPFQHPVPSTVPYSPPGTAYPLAPSPGASVPDPGTPAPKPSPIPNGGTPFIPEVPSNSPSPVPFPLPHGPNPNPIGTPSTGRNALPSPPVNHVTPTSTPYGVSWPPQGVRHPHASITPNAAMYQQSPQFAPRGTLYTTPQSAWPGAAIGHHSATHRRHSQPAGQSPFMYSR